MALKAIIQLAYAKVNPSTGDEYEFLGGQFDGNDLDITIANPLGTLVIPKSNILDVFLLAEGVNVDMDTLPAVWFLNDINA